MKSITVLFGIAAATNLVVAADSPWIFEGSTNRAPASCSGATVQSCVRCDFSRALSAQREFPLRKGLVLIIR